MATILAACPLWCGHDTVAHVDTPDEERTHHSNGQIVTLNADEGVVLHTWVERFDYIPSSMAEREPQAVISVELLRAANACDGGQRAIVLLSPGTATRWVRMLRLASDELTAEHRFRDVTTDEAPHWVFSNTTACRELSSFSLSVTRCPSLGRGHGRAFIDLGCDGTTVRERELCAAANAIEVEVHGLLDATLL